MIRRMVAIALGLSAGVAVAAEGQSVPLTYAPISSPELIVTGPARLAAGSVGWVPLPEKAVKIEGQGQSAVITIAGQEITLSWPGPREFTMATGGKPVPLRPIPKSYGLQASTVKLADGRQYTLAFPVAQIGTTEEGRRAAIFYRSGFSQNGTIDGEVVSFYDVNTDGSYQQGKDGIRVGPAGKPMVYSNLLDYFATSKAIYKIDELAENGSGLKYSKHEGPAGKLHVEFASGTSELSMILVGADGQMSAVSTSSNKVRPDLLLIPGQYRVRYGVVSLVPQGKITAIVSPVSIEPIAVEATKTATLQLGGPYKLAIEASGAGAEFKLDPSTFVLSGNSGEIYLSYNWSQPPEVSVQSGAIVKRVGKMMSEGGALTEFSGEVPDGMAVGEKKVIVSGVVEGLGPVKGEAVVKATDNDQAKMQNAK